MMSIEEIALYNLILVPKKDRLVELYRETRALEAEVEQLEQTLLDRIEGTNTYTDTLHTGPAVT